MPMNEQPFSTMTFNERLYIVNNIYVVYPRFKEILTAIDYCYHLSNLKDEPECLFLKGTTGAGKTTLIKSYEIDYPRKETAQGTVVPILSVTIPTPATVKSVVSKLLWELGDPAYDRGAISSQTIRLIGLIKSCGVKLVFLDEFQHFIDRDSAKVLKTVSDWLKNLIIETKVPMVLIGLPEAEAVFQFNSQLSRRFSTRYNLSPFSWAADEGVEFRTFLHAIETQLPLMEKPCLVSEEMALRFYYASDGIVAYVMKLIRYGTFIALKQGQEKLDLNILAQAFEQYVKADKPTKQNPFLTSNFVGNVTSDVPKDCLLTVGATNSRIKSKAKTKTAADVLRQ